MNTYEKHRGGGSVMVNQTPHEGCQSRLPRASRGATSGGDRPCPDLVGKIPAQPEGTSLHSPLQITGGRLLVHRHGPRARRRIANSVYQRHQARAVLVRYSDEFQPHSAARNHMLHDCFDPDLSFRNKKIKLDSRAHAPRTSCREEQPPHAQVADARNIFQSIASPAGPHIVMRFDSRNLSSGIERSYACGCHSSPRALRN